MAQAQQPNEAAGDTEGSDDKAQRHATSGGNPDTPDEGEDSVEEELEIARRHADPSKGDKIVDGGDHVSTEDGGNPQE